MKRTRTRSSRSASGVVGVAVIGLALAGCAGESGGSESQEPTEGVQYGASMEEYHAAFEDVDPVTLKFQTIGPEGTLGIAGVTAYADALEEWSDGKITFEWGHSNGFVPNAPEWAIGLGDGRIDIGLFLPYYNPDLFPELNNLTSMTFLDGNAPTSTLVSAAWTTDAVFSNPVYQQEAADSGIHILAAGPSVSMSAIFCEQERTSLADLEGVTVSASGTGRVTELNDLGMSTQSIAYTELYEALERGVVQCGSTVPTTLDAIGGIELVPHATADPVAGLVGFPNFIAINQDQWESLPTVAQQLLIDRLDAWFTEEPDAQGQRVKSWLETAVAAGGGIHPFEEDAREALLASNDKLLEELSASGVDVDGLRAIFEKWQGIINDHLYVDVTDDLQEFLLEDGYSELDYAPFIDAMFDEFYLDARPG